MTTPGAKRTVALLLFAAAAAGRPSTAAAQWSQTYDQFYLPASHNWAFRDGYRTADRLFNAFDYGHAKLSETLYTRPTAPASVMEVFEYDFITRKLLVKPPRVPLEEAAIAVEYAKLVPQVKLMFDWTHVLHRQIYDVWADESLPVAAKDAAVAEVLAYYKSRPDIAFSSQPKNMELMEGQYYSTAFRRKYPKFNGLIWAYHWLQVGLYEPLLLGVTPADRQTGVTAAVTRFWQMLEDAPNNMPRIMPMTAAVAPTFAARYPEAAIIFDNLHAMHDVVSDILASPEVPQNRKREEILRAAARYRDATSFVMSQDEWREMAVMMGLENMGGPAVGFLPALPEGTVPRGAVMAGMDHGQMQAIRGKQQGQPQAMDHAAMGHMAADSARPPGQAMDSSMMRMMMDMHMRMMQDSVILQRMIADTAMHQMMMQMMERMPPQHREHMRQMMDAGMRMHRHGVPDTGVAQPGEAQKATPKPAPAKKAATAVKPTDRPAPAKPAAAPPPKPVDPHAGHTPSPKKPVKPDTVRGAHR